MKKGSLLLMVLVSALTLNAQVFSEYFENATQGQKVEGYNDWYVSFKSAEANGESPVIEEEALYYDNYAGSDKGNSAVLDSLIGQEKATQRISTKVVTIGNDTLRPVLGKTMYAAFLVRVFPNSWDSYRDLFTWEGSSGSSWTRGRVFAKTVNSNSDLQLAVSKNSSGDLAESEIMEGGLELDHLLVLAYEAVEGDKNDVIKLYINPDPLKPAAEQTNVLVNIDTQSDYSESTKIKINLRQRGIGAWVGGIRVGMDWKEVLEGGASSVNKVQATGETAIYAFQNTIVTAGNGNVEVYDLGGKLVMSQFSQGRIQTNLNSGVYLVRFKEQSGNVYSGKVIINN